MVRIIVRDMGSASSFSSPLHYSAYFDQRGVGPRHYLPGRITESPPGYTFPPCVGYFTSPWHKYHIEGTDGF